MRGRRAGWAAAGLFATLGVGPLGLWTFYFVASGEEALATGREVVLVALAVAALAGGLTAFARAARADDPVGAARPLGLAVLAAVGWVVVAPL